MKKVIIIGSGRNVLSEYNQVIALAPNADTMAINFASLVGGGVNYVVSLHSNHIHTYKEMSEIRRYEDRNHGQTLGVAPKECDGVDIVISKAPGAGTSGLYAVGAALRLGYDKIILCGVPIDHTGRFYSDRGQYGTVEIKKWWRREHNKWGNKVRSMSGWTAELLGEPDIDWLQGAIT